MVRFAARGGGRPDMLPPFIIEQIRKREQEQRERQERLELPLEHVRHPEPRPVDEEADRGVLIVEL
jgi:hypothetical protein